MSRPFSEYDEIADFDKELATEVRAFLIELAEDDERLGAYIRDRLSFLRESGLSDAAQSFLMESDYSRIQHVMKSASAPARWLVIWIV